jgi:hypothetical protein
VSGEAAVMQALRFQIEEEINRVIQLTEPQTEEPPTPHAPLAQADVSLAFSSWDSTRSDSTSAHTRMPAHVVSPPDPSIAQWTGLAAIATKVTKRRSIVSSNVSLVSAFVA